MRLLKILLKIITFPVMVIVTVIQWLLTFLIGFSSVIFYVLAGLFLLVAGLSFLLGIAAGLEVLKMILAGFIVFMIPVVGQGIIAFTVMIRERMSDFIWS